MKQEKAEYKNFFMSEVEQKYTGKNPILKLISFIKYKRFITKIRSWSPSIGVLWFFADFIKIAERVYFYNNKKDAYLFSSSSYGYGENGFIIISDHEQLRITCKLFSDDQKVVLELKRLNGSNMVTEHVFQNNEWTSQGDHFNYDEVLIDNVIGIINKAMIDLVEWCWDHKGSYDYGITKKELQAQRKDKKRR